MPQSVTCECGKRATKVLASGVSIVGNLTGHHQPVDTKVERTARFQNETYYDRPDIAEKIRTGEMTVNVPKGTPDRLLPNVLKGRKYN